jgi:hypothetical protein
MWTFEKQRQTKMDEDEDFHDRNWRMDVRMEKDVNSIWQVVIIDACIRATTDVDRQGWRWGWDMDRNKDRDAVCRA